MKFHIYILLLLIGLGGTSCEDFLDTPPVSQLSLTGFWNSESDAQLGVAAIYDAAQDAFEQEYWFWGELRGDNYILNDRPGSDTQDAISNFLTNTSFGSDWSDLYTAIAHANIAIDKIPEIPDFTTQNDLLAQAHALRALFYFYAVRVWGDVPNVQGFVDDLSGDVNQPRASATDIFTQIILQDLEMAESLISTNRSPNTFARGGILALKAHVYAWPGAHQDYTIVKNAIEQVESLGYQLETTEEGWSNIFRGNGTGEEIIFWLAWNFSEDGANGGHAQFAGFTPDKVPAETLEAKWETAIPEDYRILQSAAFDVEIENPAEFPFLRILSKFLGVFTDRDAQVNASNSNDKDIPFFRFSGLLLLKAEAEHYLNNGSAALALVNRVREARALPLLVQGVDIDTSNPVAMRNLILDERQFELLGEGHRYWDLVRNGVAVEVMSQVTDINGIPNGLDQDSKILWPISQNVLNRNPNIEQNAAYR
ncbi:MAG: RagB/SusD family nutrient uptake outer membrane protein [Bacteroidota bacterium]